MPKITSFQGGFANDKNAGPEGAFWNISGLEYRKNVAYLELAKGITTMGHSLSGLGNPVAMTLWGSSGGNAGQDIIVITNTGKVVGYNTTHGTTPSGTATNAFSVGGRNYILGQNKLHKLQSGSLSLYDADIVVGTGPGTTMFTTDYRPVLDKYGDILIGNGTSIARFNEPYTNVIEYSAGVSNGCIGGLDGTVMAITQIGANVYVWCNNGSYTTVYIWDGESANPTEAIKYTDLPVQNVALLGNRHYWWTKKSDSSIRTINIGESYAQQTIIKTGFPRVALDTNASNDDNRIVLQTNLQQSLNAIETLNDNVYFPGVGCIYSFGQYFPGVGSYSLGREIVYTGTYTSAMVSGGMTSGGKDFGGCLGFCSINGGNWSVNVYNSGQRGDPGLNVFYRTSGFYESMQFIASDMYKGENDVKLIVPCSIPHSSCTIKVYEKRDEGSYEEIKTIGIADVNNGNGGFDVIEIPTSGKWRTKQLKFDLITTDTQYSPRLYIGIDNQTEQTGNIRKN